MHARLSNMNAVLLLEKLQQLDKTKLGWVRDSICRNRCVWVKWVICGSWVLFFERTQCCPAYTTTCPYDDTSAFTGFASPFRSHLVWNAEVVEAAQIRGVYSVPSRAVIFWQAFLISCMALSVNWSGTTRLSEGIAVLQSEYPQKPRLAICS